METSLKDTKMNAKYWLRTSVFNLLFYLVTLVACTLLLPTLVMPRSAFIGVVHLWTGIVGLLERFVLGLRYEIRGLDHLPSSGSYIIAAKHQSPYETMKLHTLFGDPAIILKKELLKIPLWGKYLQKIDPIAIDRSDPDSAIESIQKGAIAVKGEGRPIVIFPQGTRVWPHTSPAEKPYKVGVARIQEATDLPVIPLALNTGYFWPRQGWCKRPGKVIFEFLPAIDPGLSREELLKKLETEIEEKSETLTREAILEEKHRKRGGFSVLMLILLLLLGAAYAGWWFWMAGQVQAQHALFLKTDKELEQIQDAAIFREYSGESVSGFPGPMILRVEKENVRLPSAVIEAENFEGKSWPFPGMPVEISTGKLSMRDISMPFPLVFDRSTAKFTPEGEDIRVDYARFEMGEMVINFSGMIRKPTAPVPEIDLIITAKNYAPLIQRLTAEGILDPQSSGFILAGLRAFEKDGVLSVPLTSQGPLLYAGPFLIGNMNRL